MCNDLYIELSFIIDKKLCISVRNIKHSKRKENLLIVKNLIKEFIEQNFCYKNMILKFYSDIKIEKILNTIVIGYVLFLSNVNEQNCKLDIFNNKKSICYNLKYILDMI